VNVGEGKYRLQPSERGVGGERPIIQPMSTLWPDRRSRQNQKIDVGVLSGGVVQLVVCGGLTLLDRDRREKGTWDVYRASLAVDDDRRAMSTDNKPEICVVAWEKGGFVGGKLGWLGIQSLQTRREKER